MTPRQMLQVQRAPADGYGSVTDDAIEAVRAPWPLTPLVELLQIRREQGIAYYGEELRYHNGRDPRCDLIQELVDALLYSQQCGRRDRVAQLATMIEDLAWELSRVEVTDG